MVEKNQLLIKNVATDLTATSKDGISLVGRGLAAIRGSVETIKVETDHERYRRARTVFDLRLWADPNPNQIDLIRTAWNQRDHPELFDAFLIFEELAAKGYGKAYYPLSVLCATRDIKGLYQLEVSQEERWSGQSRFNDWVVPTVKRRAEPVATSAFAWCRANRSGADPEVLCDLGEMYYFGVGTAANFDQAIAEFRSAAELGFWPAQLWLYRSGPRAEEFEQWGQKAAEQGNAYAQYLFSGYYHERDDDDAWAYWCRSAAEQGFTAAQLKLGIWYLMGGKGLPEDGDSAIQWFRKATERDGSGCSFHLIGGVYDHGLAGVSVDDSLAFRCYQTSAHAGWASGQCALGKFYAQGRVVPQSNSLAAHWYEKSSDQGGREANFLLAECYDYGRGVQRDLAKAVVLYKNVHPDDLERAAARLRALYVPPDNLK